MAVFRITSDQSTRSDRSARDRLRHRQKVRSAIKENIADIVDESIASFEPTRTGRVEVKKTVSGALPGVWCDRGAMVDAFVNRAEALAGGL